MLTPRRLILGQPAAGPGALYTATNVRARIDAFVIINPSAGALTFSIWLVPSGGAVGNPTALVLNRSIAAGQSLRVLEAIGQWIEAGGTVQMSASTAATLTVQASGVEQTGS